jgi:hypothetical protein
METVMSKTKAQAIKLLQDIPDDKILSVIEILQGLKLLYLQTESSDMYEATNENAMGIFSKYANPDLVYKEKDAWAEAVKEKYAIN